MQLLCQWEASAKLCFLATGAALCNASFIPQVWEGLGRVNQKTSFVTIPSGVPASMPWASLWSGFVVSSSDVLHLSLMNQLSDQACKSFVLASAVGTVSSLPPLLTFLHEDFKCWNNSCLTREYRCVWILWMLYLPSCGKSIPLLLAAHY